MRPVLAEQTRPSRGRAVFSLWLCTRDVGGENLLGVDAIQEAPMVHSYCLVYGPSVVGTNPMCRTCIR